MGGSGLSTAQRVGLGIHWQTKAERVPVAIRSTKALETILSGRSRDNNKSFPGGRRNGPEYTRVPKHLVDVCLSTPFGQRHVTRIPKWTDNHFSIGVRMKTLKSAYGLDSRYRANPSSR